MPCPVVLWALPDDAGQGRLPSMHSLARFLQLAGLTIPPLAMVVQLSGDISTGPMLQMLFFSVGLFLLGYTLQRYGGTS